MALARKPFVVIDAEILSSSVWSEAAHVRLVWLTLLILCDTEGYVGAALPGIARAAGVSLQEAEEAMARFQEPDPYSRTQDNEGRRVTTDERGWRILNFAKALERLSVERTKARERVRRHREKKRGVTRVTRRNVTSRSGNREQGIVKREQRTEKENERPFSLVEESANGNGPLTEEQKQEYADAVWSAYTERTGRTTQLASPSDFATLKGWIEAGIPLRIVIRGMLDTKGTGRTLAYFAPSVKEAHERWRRTVGA